MIEAVAVEDISADSFCRLTPGTLELRSCRQGETPAFKAQRDIKEGEAVSILPLDQQAILMNEVVAGAYKVGGNRADA